MQNPFSRIIYRVVVSAAIAIISGAAFLLTLNYGPCGLSGGDQGAGGGAPAGMMAIAVTMVSAILLVAIVILVEISKATAIIKTDITPRFWLVIFTATIVCSIAFASWFLYMACMAK